MDAERDVTKEAQNIETLLMQDLDLLFYWPYDREAAAITFMENCLTTYGNDILICCIDGTQEAFDLIEDGEVAMTVLQNPY